MQLSLVIHDMGLWDHLVAAVICIFAPVLAMSSRRIAAEDVQFDAEDKIRLYHSNALLLFVFALVIVTTWRIPGRSLHALGFGWPQWNVWVIVLLIAVCLFYMLDLFFQYGLRRWRQKSLQQRQQTISFVPENKNELFHFSFLALSAGISEEIIFRGYLMHYLVFWAGQTPTGMIIASFFSSALFAFLHGYQGGKAMVKIFFLAMLFSAIFIMSQSLWVVILLHALIDIFSGWIGIYLVREMRQHENEHHES